MVDRNWQQSVDTDSPGSGSIPISGKYFMWFWKAFTTGDIGGAVSGTWTHVWSTDGVTTSSVEDLWGTGSFDDAKIVQAAPASPHSSRVDVSPVMDDGNTYYRIIDAVALAYSVDIVYSKTAPVGGSISTRRSASDEWVHSNMQIVENAVGPSRLHGLLSSKGDFVVAYSKNTSGQMYSEVSAFCPAERPTGMTKGLFTHTGYSPAGAFTFGTFYTSWKGYGTATNTPLIVIIAYPASAVGIFALENCDVSGDAIDQKSISMPMWLFSSTALNKGRLGRLPDLVWGCTSQGPALTPVGAPYTSCLIDDVWLPFNVIPTM